MIHTAKGWCDVDPDYTCVWHKPQGSVSRRRGSLGRRWTTLRVLTKAGHLDMAGRSHLGWFPWQTAVRGSSLRSWPNDWSYEEVAKAVKKKKPPEGNVTTSQVPVASEYLADMPHLIEHLSVRVYDDRSPRVPGTMLLSTLGAVWKMVLKDPDSRQQLQVVAPTLDELFIAVEALLGSENAPWEPDPWAKGTSPKKSSK